jgi:hypothetical protein|tara:strand:- start:1359 stop:1583 length:225 start_codon:yes stop_codon:yes gene_type:complete
MNLIPVEGEKDLFRDPRTNAIINTNQSDYLTYINSRKIRQNEKNKIDILEKDVNSIKNDLNEIKSLLRSIANEP